MAEEDEGFTEKLVAWIGSLFARMGSWSTKAKVITATLTVVVGVVFFDEIYAFAKILFGVVSLIACISWMAAREPSNNDERRHWWKHRVDHSKCMHCGSRKNPSYATCPRCGKTLFDG